MSGDRSRTTLIAQTVVYENECRQDGAVDELVEQELVEEMREIREEISGPSHAQALRRARLPESSESVAAKGTTANRSVPSSSI